MAKIALIGYGKMGQVIESLAKCKGHEIKVIIDPTCEKAEKEINETTLKDVDVCIDFTHPDAVLDNVKKIASLGKNMVIGTTGWYDHLDEVEKIVKENDIGLIWSGNFSIGVNVFFKIVENAAKIINNVDEYDIYGLEAHHNQKKDSPSGTAKMIADILLKNIDRKDSVVYDKLDRQIKPNELHFASVRGGQIIGEHVVGLDSQSDNIELKHSAKNRSGYALGSLMAAEFIKDKKGLFNINDLMKNIIR